MSAVVVLTEDDFAVGTGDGISELVAIAAPLQNRRCNSKIGRAARRGITAEQIRYFCPAKSKNPAVRSHSDRSNRREMRFGERTEALVLVKREQEPRGIGREHTSGVTIASLR